MLVALALLRTRLPEDVLDALERSAARRQLPVHRHGTDALGRWLLTIIEAAKRRADLAFLAALSRTVEDELPMRLAGALRFDRARASPRRIPARYRALD
jgi:hypothetical protein